MNYAVRRTVRAAASAPRRPAIVRECSHASHRRLRPEYRCAFCKAGVTSARKTTPPERDSGGGVIKCMGRLQLLDAHVAQFDALTVAEEPDVALLVEQPRVVEMSTV